MPGDRLGHGVEALLKRRQLRAERLILDAHAKIALLHAAHRRGHATNRAAHRARQPYRRQRGQGEPREHKAERHQQGLSPALLAQAHIDLKIDPACDPTFGLGVRRRRAGLETGSMGAKTHGLGHREAFDAVFEDGGCRRRADLRTHRVKRGQITGLGEDVAIPVENGEARAPLGITHAPDQHVQPLAIRRDDPLLACDSHEPGYIEHS